MSTWDGTFAGLLFETVLYPNYEFTGSGNALDQVVWALGSEDLLAWTPQVRVLDGSLELSQDLADPWFLATDDFELFFGQPLEGPDVLLLPYGDVGIGAERVTLDLSFDFNSFELQNCPYDTAPNDGSGNYAGRIGDGQITIADITPVLSAFGAGSFPAQAITDLSPAGGDGEQTIADINAVLGAFGLCPTPANDNCANAQVITDGATEFTNVNSTTDGPDHTGDNACIEFGSGDVTDDVWYLYTPTCGSPARVQVSTGGSNWDTKVAVYDASGGCPTDSSSLLGCNDDNPNNVFTYRSFIEIANVTTDLLIRVGASPAAVEVGNTAPPTGLPGDTFDGWNGTTGNVGVLSIACLPQDNDACQDALELVIGGPSVLFDNATATNENPAPPAVAVPIRSPATMARLKAAWAAVAVGSPSPARAMRRLPSTQRSVLTRMRMV
jgi:hypothetical protein